MLVVTRSPGGGGGRGSTRSGLEPGGRPPTVLKNVPAGVTIVPTSLLRTASRARVALPGLGRATMPSAAVPRRVEEEEEVEAQVDPRPPLGW